MLKLRCTLLATAMVLAAGNVSAALIVPALLPQAQAVAVDAKEEEVPASLYVLRVQGGEVCVFQGDTLVQRTGVSAASLPASDRTLLDGGISVSSPAELASLLEDLTS